MAIPGIGSIGSLSSAFGLGGAGAVGALGGASTAPAGAVDAATGGFGDALLKALDGVSAANSNVDQLALQAATGDLAAVHDYTIAATEAQLLTQLTTEVRNRAVEAFNDIMHMQV